MPMSQAEIDARIAKIQKGKAITKVLNEDGTERVLDPTWSIENATEPEAPHARNDGRTDVSVPHADLVNDAEARAQELARRGEVGQRIADVHVMPTTSEEPTPANSARIGTLQLWNSDDGGFWASSRKKVYCKDEAGVILKKPEEVVWHIFEEVRRLKSLLDEASSLKTAKDVGKRS